MTAEGYNRAVWIWLAVALSCAGIALAGAFTGGWQTAMAGALGYWVCCEMSIRRQKDYTIAAAKEMMR